MEDSSDQDLDVAVVEAGDGIAEDDRGTPGDALADMRSIFCSPFELGPLLLSRLPLGIRQPYGLRQLVAVEERATNLRQAGLNRLEWKYTAH